VGLEVRREGDWIIIVVSDDGVGLPDSVDPEAPGSFGLLLVTSLARQLDARMEVSTQGGTRIRLSIPSPRAREG
jgi:two-component sensor histidine kinase